MTTRTLTVPGLALMLATTAPAAFAADDKPEVHTTFYPTAYFTQRIAGDAVEVVNPVPDDADAIFWQPSREDLLAYQEADLIVLNGAGFAKWVENATLPQDRVVDTAKPFEDAFIRYEDAVTHSHGDSGEHSHEGLDGHTWLDPVNAKAQAGVIRDALVERFPEHADAFEAGYAALARDLDELDTTLRRYVEEGNGDAPMLMSHPAYNYIARRYGWNIENLDLDPGEMPSDEQFAEIARTKEEHPASYMIWEGEPLPEIERRLEDELGLESITFSPVELLSPEQKAAGLDYMDVMRANVQAMEEVFLPESS